MTRGKADSFHSNSSDTPMNGDEIVLQPLCDTVSNIPSATILKKQPKFAVLIFLAALSVLPLNMFIPSLPHIADALSSNYAVANLAIAGYALMSALTHVVAHRR